MGKWSTASRAANGGNRAKRTSHHKLANKKRQRTPKVVRKQMNRSRLNRKQEMEQITHRAQRKMQQLSFNNLTSSIKHKLTNNTNATSTPHKQRITRTQRNKFSRQNKKLKKQQEKQQQQKEKFDFSSYNRTIESDESSQEDNDNNIFYSDTEQKEEQLLQQFENKHTPKSFDITKSKLSYQSATGDWIRHSEPVQNKDVIINEQQIADYMNLGNDNNDVVMDDVVMDGSDDNDNDVEIKKKLTVSEWKLQKKTRMNAVKLEIAEMCEKIIEDPYKNCGLLNVIYNLCLDEDVQIAQLSMLSITKIVIDIMPPYKIGTIDQNIALKRSNEKVREFEKTLLNAYQLFLKHTFKLARIYHSNVRNKTKKKNPKRFILGRCSIKCILLFIRKCSHFNYTKELIKNAIPLTNCKVEPIRKDACAAIGSLLSHRPINNVTVECVQLLCQRIEKKNFNVHPDQIKILQRLPLEYLEPPDNDSKEEKDKPTKSRWEKELDKKMKKDAKESAILDKKKLYQRQKVIIEAIFGVYFYILKLEVSTNLLEPALGGMSKFTHLINIELILDLVSVISEKLASQHKKLSLTCKLMMISTTFKCLSGRGTSIAMDVRQHYQTIYNLLLSVTLNYYEWDKFYLIFECLNSMFGFHASKSLPIDRIASFVKRLINISSQLPPCYAIGCQHMARKLMLSDPRLYNMLDYEGGYDKPYHPFEMNPDQCNALSCCLWELTLTSNHFHPFSKVYSRDLATWSEIQLRLSTMTPDKVIRKYDVCAGNFRPFVKESKLQKFSIRKHPPKDLNNEKCMVDMVDWFGYDVYGERYDEQQVRTVKESVVDRDGMVGNVVDNYSKCNDLLIKNCVLKELNEEYKLLNQLLQTD